MKDRNIAIGLLLAAGLSVGAGMHTEISIIRGKIIYRGTAEGPVKVEVFDRPQFAPRPVHFAVLSESGLYEARVHSGTYYLRAYIDVNRSGKWDPGEPVGLYGEGRPVVIVPLESKLGIDIRIEDDKKAVQEPEKK